MTFRPPSFSPGDNQTQMFRPGDTSMLKHPVFADPYPPSPSPPCRAVQESGNVNGPWQPEATNVFLGRGSSEFRPYGSPLEFFTSVRIGIKFCEITQNSEKRSLTEFCKSSQNSAIFPVQNSRVGCFSRVVWVSLLRFLFNFVDFPQTPFIYICKHEISLLSSLTLWYLYIHVHVHDRVHAWPMYISIFISISMLMFMSMSIDVHVVSVSLSMSTSRSTCTSMYCSHCC